MQPTNSSDFPKETYARQECVMFINHLSSSIEKSAKRELPVKTQLIWFRQHKKHLAFSLATKTKVRNTMKPWIQSWVLREIITSHVGRSKSLHWYYNISPMTNQWEARTALIGENSEPPITHAGFSLKTTDLPLRWFSFKFHTRVTKTKTKAIFTDLFW